MSAHTAKQIRKRAKLVDPFSRKKHDGGMESFRHALNDHLETKGMSYEWKHLYSRKK